MRTYNTYIVSLIVAAGFVNALLASMGQRDLALYFIVNSIAYLAITLVYAYINPRARTALNTIGAAWFAGFLAIVSLKVVQIMSGR